MRNLLWIILLAAVALTLVIAPGAGLLNKETPKMNGVSLVAPPREMSLEDLTSINQVNANWVAVIPFGFSQAGQPSLVYNTPGQWWGERIEGARRQIEMAHELGKKVMLKPHVWVRGQGWPGDFTLNSEADWQKWEQDYRTFILDYASLAEETQTELLSIGCEFRYAVRERPAFWEQLIPEIRQRYHGKLTYASNWDNYERVTFWKQLDYIGIDAYFPLIEGLKHPSAQELEAGWRTIAKSLKAFSEQEGKPIVFTEYGFRSIDYTASGHWNIPESEIKENQQAQADCYASLFRTLWQEPWFGGGFLWKWFTQGDGHGRRETGFTPQNKLAEPIIARYYGEE